MSDDSDALQVVARAIPPGKECTIVHYVYLPRGEDVAPVSEALRKRGFRVESRMSADGVNWLVLARHRIVPSVEVILETRSCMNEIAGSYGGEYDGWEADLVEGDVPGADQ